MEQNDKSDGFFLTIRGQIERIDEILAETIDSTDVPIIKDVARHIILSGGKRFRPALAVLSSKICGYLGDPVLYIGAAIELVHTASLIHDDVLDGAELRRGVSSINAKWGNHLSILVGDYCLSQASRILTKHANSEIILLSADAVMKTTEGEVLEVVHSNDLSVDEDIYMKIIQLKTAYLIATSCKIGGLLAVAPEHLLVALWKYGMNIGIAFQIVDDILDYTIENKVFGKKRGTDLKEGKLTLPVIYSLRQCSQGEKETIKGSLLTSTYSKDNFESVAAILNKYDCIDKAKGVASRHITLAKEALAPFRASLEKDALIKFADMVLNRDS